MRKPKVFKQISKKYQLEAPVGHTPDKPFFGEIEFFEEHFTRVVNFKKLTRNDKNFVTSNSPYEVYKILLEIMMDGQVKDTIELSLNNYIGKDHVSE